MNSIIIAGCGTEIGKTIVSAIITTAMQGDYWKPIQCGEAENSDTTMMHQLINVDKHCIYNPAYSLKAPLSPHHAARLEGVSIDIDSIIPPKTLRPLVIESVGGVLVPLNSHKLSIDLFNLWNSKWVIVSKHYLGSINHTLLTIEVLKQRKISIAGIIFNGEPNVDTETAILENSQISCLGRLLPESTINSTTIQRYAAQWKQRLSHLIP